MIQIGQNDSKCFTSIIGDLYFPMYFHMYPCGVPHTHSKKWSKFELKYITREVSWLYKKIGVKQVYIYRALEKQFKLNPSNPPMKWPGQAEQIL